MTFKDENDFYFDETLFVEEFVDLDADIQDIYESSRLTTQLETIQF